MTDILDLHTHTVASGHAYNSLYEMAQSAHERGLVLYGCSDHAPAMPGTCHEYYFSNFRAVPRVIRGIPVLMGAELNIVDFEGGVDLSPSLLGRLDYAIASIHPQCIPKGTIEDYTRAYLGAMKNRFVRIIGHPDDGRLPVDYERLVAAAKEAHVLLEVNSSSLSPGSVRKNARENYKRMLTLCMEQGVSVILGSDAHVEADIGNHRCAWELLDELGFPEELVVNTSLERAAAYLPVLARLLTSDPGLFVPGPHAPIRRWEEGRR